MNQAKRRGVRPARGRADPQGEAGRQAPPQHPMPDEMLEAVAGKFRALSQAPRLRLLESLFDGPLSVNELAERAGLGQANTSKHLAVLAQSGFVTRTRRGTQVAYQLADEMPKQLCALLCGRVMSEVEDDLRRIRGG